MSEGSELFAARDDDFFEAYRFILPGYNVRPQEINAAVGLVQLAKLPAMTEMRRKNLAKFQNLFEGDERFIIQRENGKSSSFCFTIILSPGLGFDRDVVMEALKAEDIGFRIITGGCFPRHDVIKYFDYELLGEMTNGDLAHDRGFFVGNHPFDLGTEIDALHRILDAACK